MVALGATTSFFDLRFIWTLFLVCALVEQGYAEGGNWRTGRATYYNAIHHGACGYGGVDPHKGLGLNIAAIPDVHPDYKGSCGECYEVKCHPVDMYDRYGGELKRSGKDVCKDPNMSIVVKIIDECPCSHNHQWCCGDMDHFDLSEYAFLRLAAQRWGVIGLKYRKVSCDHDVNKTSPPPTFEPSVPTKPGKKPAKKPSKASRKASKKASRKAAASEKAVVPVEKKNKKYLPVFESKFKNGFTDGGLIPYTPLNGEGFSRSPAWCTNVSARRGVAIVGGAKKFHGASELEFWVKESWGIPDFKVSLFGKKGLFNEVKIQNLKTVAKDYASNLHMKSVSMEDLLEGTDQKLKDAHSIVFINPLDWDQGLCIDAVKLVYPL